MNIRADRASRIKLADQFGMKTQEQYEQILDEIASLRLHKVHMYGESRYEEKDQDFSMNGVHWDIYRKFIRLRQLFKFGWRVTLAGESLRDTLIDLANYAVMGVQLIDSYKKGGEASDPR